METYILDLSRDNSRTDFLLPKRNFWSGFSSVLNIFGNSDKFNTSSSAEEADIRALSSDWQMIGDDFRKVLSSDLIGS